MKLKANPPLSLETSTDERIKEFIRGAKGSPVLADSSKSFPQSKVVRDGFSMPLEDYQLIDKSRRRALNLGLSDIDGVTKSQILRVALKLLERIEDQEFIQLFELTRSVKKKQ